MSLQQDHREARKARLKRIAAAAWKPPVKPEPVVEVPPPEPTWRDPRAELLEILSRGHPAIIETYPHVSKIQRIVAAYYNIGINDVLSVRRAAHLVRVRHIAIYLCEQLTPLSTPDIGRRFAGRDHTTVLNAISSIKEKVAADPKLAAEIEELKQLIGKARSA